MNARWPLGAALLVIGLVSAPRGQDTQRAGSRPTTPYRTLANGLRWRCVPVAGTQHVAVFLGFDIGSAHDPATQTGLARIMEALLSTCSAGQEPRRTAAERQASHPLGVGGITRGSCTVLWAIRERAGLAAEIGRVAAVLGGIAIDDEDLDREKSEATNVAVMETEWLPGTILQWRARAAVLGHDSPLARPTCGTRAGLAAIDLATVRARSRLYAPHAAWLIVVGAVDAAEVERLVSERCGGLAAGGSGATAVPALVPAAGLPAVAEEPCPRVGAPFVTAAFAAPPPASPDHAAFHVATQILIARVQRGYVAAGKDGAGFAGRGAELQARFLPVQYELFDLPTVLLVNRRGRDGQARDSVEQEVRAVVGALGTREVEARELEVARRLLRPMSVPTPVPADWEARVAQNPRMLFQLGLACALGDVLGVPPDYRARVDAVTAAEVRAAAARWLAPTRARWVALVPPH